MAGIEINIFALSHISHESSPRDSSTRWVKDRSWKFIGAKCHILGIVANGFARFRIRHQGNFHDVYNSQETCKHLKLRRGSVTCELN